MMETRDRSQRFWSTVWSFYHATAPVLKTGVLAIITAFPIALVLAIKLIDTAISILDVTKGRRRTYRSSSPFDRRGGPFKYPY